ncbi:MAG TPA: DoxX family protein [bacterium]|jgi:hypothetical protein|nr:DoxX family protein [bacterium]
MNILLWVLQVGTAFFYIAGGSYKITHFEQLKKMGASMRALPKAFWACVGAFEALAGAGLVLPAALHIFPVLSATAAACLAVESVLVVGLFLSYRDFAPVPYAAGGGLVAAFIAYGRFALAPF